MKSLVIAEKPSVARDIARVLHCSQKGNGTLEGKAYVADLSSGLGLLQLLCQIELFHLFLIAFSA